LIKVDDDVLMSLRGMFMHVAVTLCR
jgi:hypothetical protein